MNNFIELEKNLLLCDSVSKQSLRSEIEGSELDEQENDAEQDDGIESKSNDEFDKYLKLANLFGNDVFIYDKDTETIAFSENFQAKSEYLLCIECMKKIDNKDVRDRMSGLFEECSAEAIKNYLGKDAQYKLIDDTRKQTIDFEKFCSEELFEKNHPNAQENFENNEKIPRCDVVAWKPLDKMSGKIILLVQCKSGKNWKNSTAVNLRLWKENLIYFTCEPISVYTITDIIDENESFIDRGKEKGLILDRARIIRLLATAKTDKIEKVRIQIKELFKNSKLRV